jgi:DNA-binding CsgD family transcriptional regulator
MAPYATQALTPLAAITTSNFYKFWLQPNGLGARVGVKLCDYPDCRATLVLDLAPDIPADRQTALLTLLGVLAPHIQRSIEFARRLSLGREEAWRVGVIRNPEAMALLDGSANVYLSNQAMDRTVASGLCSLSTGRKLRLHRADDTARLAAVLSEASKGRRSLSWPHIMAFEVPGQIGPNVLAVEALERLRDHKDTQEVSLFGGAPLAPLYLVTMRIRSLLRGPSAEQIRVGLGLTPKQADAVWSLVHGESIEKQAQDRGLSVDGVRWHFKNIYQRTGCSTQAELVRLVISLFGPAPR